MMCRNPFALIATIVPVSPVVRSLIWARRPAAVSLRLTWSLSPCVIKSVSLLPAKLPDLIVSGPGGPIGVPLVLRKAKLAGSMQLSFSRAFGGLRGPWRAPYSPWRLKIASAAHQCVLSQEILSLNGGYPGG